MRGATTKAESNAEALQFQPTLPMRGATARLYASGTPWRYFNPRSPCGERRYSSHSSDCCGRISTHAPHAGSDVPIGWRAGLITDISTHAPHAGSDLASFLAASIRDNFNPRSPCGERPKRKSANETELVISTHAPHAGSDFAHVLHGYFPRFQPTLPMRGATWDDAYKDVVSFISTHAPHAGSDQLEW